MSFILTPEQLHEKGRLWAHEAVDDSSTVGEQFGLLQTLYLFMAAMHLQVQARTPRPVVLIVALLGAHEREELTS